MCDSSYRITDKEGEGNDFNSNSTSLYSKIIISRSKSELCDYGLLHMTYCRYYTPKKQTSKVEKGVGSEECRKTKKRKDRNPWWKI